MNTKQLVIAINFLIPSHFAMGAIYDLQDEQQSLSSNQDMTSTLKKELDNTFSNMELSANIKQGYHDTLKLIEENQLENAEHKINLLIKQYPKEAEFYNLQALLEIFRKNYSLAIKSYQDTLKLNPKNLLAHQGLAQQYLRAGNLEQAKKHTNTALSINDKSANTYLLLADIASKENHQQDIEKILLTAQRKTQGNIKQELTLANNLAKLYIAQKQPEKILTLAHGIIKRYPEQSSALSFLASAQVLNGKNKQAAQTLEKLIDQEKKDIRHRLLLAGLLINQHEKEQQVIKLLDEVTSIAPNNLQALTQKTTFLIQMKHYKAALNSANKIKKLAPDSGLAELLEGKIYQTENKMDTALAAYQKSYKIKPNIKAINQITNIMIAQGKQSDAINFLNKELKKYPKNLTIHFNLASIYGKQKNSSEAEKHYQAILSKQPDNAHALNNLAWLYHLQNNPKALPLAEKAYQKKPKSADIADTYGTILVKQGDLKKGIQVLEKASKLAPSAYDTQYHLANAYALNGDSKQAQKILNSILKSEHYFSEKNAALSLAKELEKTNY